MRLPWVVGTEGLRHRPAGGNVFAYAAGAGQVLTPRHAPFGRALRAGASIMAQTVVALRLVGAIYIVEWTRRRSSALRPSRLSWFFGSIMTANLSGTMRWPNARDFGRLPVAYCAIAAIIPHHHAT